MVRNKQVVSFDNSAFKIDSSETKGNGRIEYNEKEIE